MLIVAAVACAAIAYIVFGKNNDTEIDFGQLQELIEKGAPSKDNPAPSIERP